MLGRLLQAARDAIALAMGDDRTRLRELVRRGATRRVRALLDADPAALDRTWDSPDGMTLLCDAALAGQAGVVALLLERGAERTKLAIGPRDAPLWRTAETAHAYAAVDGIKNALVFARLSGNDDAYRALAASASPDELGLALVAAARARNERWIEDLLVRGAPANHVVAYDGARPLHTCVQLGFFSGVRRLVEAGADLDAPLQPVELDPDHERAAYEDDRQTALYLAAAGGHHAIATYLLDRGARVDHARELDATPLMVAVERRDLELARLLLARGANRDARCPAFFDGRTVRELQARDPRPGWELLTDEGGAPP